MNTAGSNPATVNSGGTAPSGVTEKMARPTARPFMSPGTHTGTGGETAEPKLRDYLRILGYHWKLLILVALIPMAGAGAYTWMKTKRYRAKSVLVRPEGGARSNKGGDIPLRLALEAVGRNQELLNHAHMVLSDKLQKSERSLPCPVPEPTALRAAITAGIEGRGSDLVITAIISAKKSAAKMSDRDYGQLAAYMADAYAQALIERSDSQRKKAVLNLRTRIETQLTEKSKSLGEKFREILQHRARMGSGGTDAPLSSEVEKAARHLGELEKMRQTAVFRRDELEKKLKRIVETIEQAEIAVPDPDLRDLRRALIKVEMALAHAEIRYQKSHPKYKKLILEKKLLVTRLRSKTRSISAPKATVDVGRLQVQRELGEAELAGLRARLSTIDATLKTERRKLSDAMERIKSMAPSKALSEMLREKEVLTLAIAALQRQLEGLSEADVVVDLPRLAPLSWSTPPSTPYTPKWAVNIPVGLGLAMVLVLAAAFIAENLENRIRDQEDLVRHFDLPFLGPVPLWREGEAKLINLDRPRAVIASVHEVLRNNINYALPAGAPKVLLVASSVQGEGKSTIAANLAISYCLDGNNVLLIDTDLRRPRAHRLFESLCPQAASSKGLTAYLSGRAPMEEILFQASVPGLSIISAGHGAVNPSKLLGSEMMRSLVKGVTDAFDVVILDGPAVLPVVDSTVVSAMASGVLLVVSSKRPQIQQVSTAIGRLVHVQAPLIGMVLNRQPGGSRGYYHYYGSRYGYGYGQAYSYHQDEAEN